VSAASVRAGTAPRARARRLLSGRRDVLVVYGCMVALLVAGRVISASFLSSFNLQSLVAGGAALALVAIGQTFVVLTGGIDLSVGSVMSLTTVLAAFSMHGSDARFLPVALMCIAVGAGIGLVNGLVIGILRIEPIIVTLGAMSVVQGIAFLRSQQPGGLVSPVLGNLVYEEIGPIPKPAVVIVVFYALALLLLRGTRYGMRVYALGGAEESARLSGISTMRVKVSVYVISGLFSALAGLILTARLGQGDPLAGQSFMLTSVAVVAIGGTSLFGGRGGLSGTLAAATILTVLANILNLEGVDTYPQQLITGSLVIIVVALYSLRRPQMRWSRAHRVRTSTEKAPDALR
jgi:ribose transport system permease protein